MKNNHHRLFLAVQSAIIAYYVHGQFSKIVWIVLAAHWFMAFITYWTAKQYIRGKVIRPEDLSPELQEKMNETVRHLVDEMEEKNPELFKNEHKKCNDPHCKTCWGYGDEK